MINSHPRIPDALYDFEMELFIRSYSQKTINSYKRCLKEYFEHLESYSHLQKKYEDFDFLQNFDEFLIKNFLKYKKEHNCSPKTLHVYLSSIKCFWKALLKN